MRQHDGAYWTHQKARAEDGEGHHQRRKFTACREERVGDVGGIEAERKKSNCSRKLPDVTRSMAPAFERTVAGEVEENMVISSLLLTFYASVFENWIRMRK